MLTDSSDTVVSGLNSEIAWDFSVKSLHVLPMQLVGLG